MPAEEVVGRHFKKAKAKQRKIILEHIMAVMECVKPSFLFDMVAASNKELQEFLLELNQEIDQELVLLCVDSVHPFFGQRRGIKKTLYCIKPTAGPASYFYFSREKLIIPP